MIVEKENVKRVLTDEKTIAIFIQSGWNEVKETKKKEPKKAE